jgi:hypothetical protein
VRLSAGAFAVILALGVPAACGAADVAVPSACMSDVNAPLARLVAGGGRVQVDNVMVCGTTISSSRRQRGGPHGDHQILPLRVVLPGAGAQLIEVVTNDDLDGIVTAPAGAAVFAYGQFYEPARRPFVAGIHDVHCSTHRAADNGWVVVDGRRFPQRACTR